jgi:TubC N-terminal docking domain
VNAAGDLLIRLRSTGIGVATDGDELRLRATKGMLTPGLVHEVQARKSGMIDLLRNEERNIAWRIDVIGTRLLADPAERSPGRCAWCGGRMPGQQSPKCVLCCLAAATLLEIRNALLTTTDVTT